MIDPNKRPTAGKPFAPSAAVFGAFIDATNQFNLEKTSGPSGGEGFLETRPSTTVTIHNTTASDRTAGDILAINGATASFPTKSLEATRRPLVTGTTPTSTDDLFAILTDGIKADKCGRAVISGVACCTVNITDTGHEFATATASDATRLTSAASGPARILAKASTGTGNKVCMVLLGGGSGGGDTGVWLRVTSETATSSTYPAVLLTNNGDGTRSDGTVVRFKLLGGDSVVDESIYWATRNGTVTISSVTYDLYDGVGNDSEYIRDCVDGVDGYRTWKIPHPWSISTFTAGDPP